MALTAPSHRRRSRSFPHHRRGVLLRCAVLTVAVVKAYDTIDGHPCFRNLRGITKSMFDLVDAHPDLASVSVIGESFLRSTDSNSDEYGLPQNGYEIYAMNITSLDGPRRSSEKGKTLVTSGVHAREYAPPELVMRFAELLLGGYGADSDITWLLEHTEVHLIFHVNPDGRYVAETYPETMWRKNMNRDKGHRCDPDEVGVDINRNFDFRWGEEGSSSDPCDSTYRGRSANSEPETRAVVEYARDLFPDEQRRDDPENEPLGEEITGLFIDIHSPGGYVYYPWGFEDKTSPDDDALQSLARKLGFFNGYVLWSGGQPDFQYAVSGVSSDYMYGVLGVASFALELGEDFYEDCDLFEDAVAPDNLPALLYAASTSRKPFSHAKGPDVFDLEVGLDECGELLVTAAASDSAMVNGLRGYPDFATGDQGVAEVRLYLDVHPDDYMHGDTSWLVRPAESDSGKETFEAEVSLAGGVSAGRHILYARAMDEDGYSGPVSSAFFHGEKVKTLLPTCRPASSPRRVPPGAPTTVEPSASPTETPSASPSRTPTLSPATAKPSTPPTGDPTASPSRVPSSSPAIAKPSAPPTGDPTASPSQVPSRSPATHKPSELPSRNPTPSPSNSPSGPPTTDKPSALPTQAPMAPPTSANPSATLTTYSTTSGAPSFPPTFVPSSGPSMDPTDHPTAGPSNSPTTPDPTFLPTEAPTPKPTRSPNLSLTPAPSSQPKLVASVTAILPALSPGYSSYTPFSSAGLTVAFALVLMYLG